MTAAAATRKPAAAEEASPHGDTAWLGLAERGSLTGMLALLWLLKRAGRGAARAVLPPLALYYLARDPVARRASRQWLERVARHRGDDRPVRTRDVHRHLLRFAQVTLDRLLLVQGETAGLNFVRHGGEHLDALIERGQGALLVGAHLGSFEALRMFARRRGVRIHALAWLHNARMINALLERLERSAGNAAKGSVRVLALEPGRFDALLEAREAIARGEFVAVLGDRVGVNDKTASVPFFGQQARFPTGPWLIAALIGCPVLLTFGLYEHPDTYHGHCEPFADRIQLPRGPRRQAELERVVARYAARLEALAAERPDNWFNFFDFWEASS